MFSLIISWLRAVNNSPRLSFPHTFSSSVNSLMKDLGHGEKTCTFPPLSCSPLASFNQTNPEGSNRWCLENVCMTISWDLSSRFRLWMQKLSGQTLKTREMMCDLFLPSWLLNCLIVNLGINLPFNPYRMRNPTWQILQAYYILTGVIKKFLMASLWRFL